MSKLVRVSVLLVMGCRENVEIADGFCAQLDMTNSHPADMTSPAANCAAAKGLSGDILGGLCLDMGGGIDTQALTTRGFNLTASTVNCSGWEVSGTSLQPNNASTATGPVKCGLLLPNLPFDGNKYPRVTLSIIQQANVPNAMQQARIEIFDITSPLRIWVNPTVAVDQRTIVEVPTTDLPAGPNAQATIEIDAPMGSQVPSWTISSIAVLGQLAP